MADALLARARKLARGLQASHYSRPGAPPPRVLCAGFVAASAPPPADPIPLSLLDTELYRVFGGVAGALFFHQRLDEEAVRGGLASALSAYPILAGRARSAAGDARPPYALHCCNSGASFTVLDGGALAEPSDRAAAARGGGGGALPPWPAMWDCPPLWRLADDPDGALLDVTLLHFASGSALLINVSHAVADGVSIAMFLRHWAAAGGPEAGALLTPTLARAEYDAACGVALPVPAPPPARAACLPRSGSRVATLPEAAAAAAVSAPAGSGKPRARTSPLGGITLWPSAREWAGIYGALARDSSLGALPGPGKVARLVIPLPRATLARLKEAAVTGCLAAGATAEQARRLSSNDVACALLWRAISVSRRRCLGGERERICFTASTRALLLPPARQAYFGNATVVVAAPPLSRSELHSASLGALAGHIRVAKARVTADAVREEMAFVAAHAAAAGAAPRAQAVRWDTLPLGGRTVGLDWSFPLGLDAPFCGAVPYWFEPQLGYSGLPYLFGMTQPADGDGLIAHVHLPGDEAPLFLRHMAVVLLAE